MADYGTRQTDLAVRRAKWRISRIYGQAKRDIEAKMKDWQKRHAAREAKYRAQVKAGKMSQADFDAWMRGQVFQGKQWQAKLAEIDSVLLNADNAATNVVNQGKLGVFADNANYIGRQIQDDLNIKAQFNMYDERTVARLLEANPDMLPPRKPGKDKSYRWYNKRIKSQITQGILQGDTIQQIARRIADTTNSTYSSALTYARTAYTGAQNAGRMEMLRQAQGMGINVRKQWLSAHDGHTRDAHVHLDGQVQDVEEPFDSDLGEIMYPGDPAADPANVWNCRCSLVYIYPDYE